MQPLSPSLQRRQSSVKLLSACGHPTHDTSHLVLHCSATDSLRRTLFGDSFTIHDLWSLGGLPDFSGSMVFRHFSKVVGCSNKELDKLKCLHDLQASTHLRALRWAQVVVRTRKLMQTTISFRNVACKPAL